MLLAGTGVVLILTRGVGHYFISMGDEQKMQYSELMKENYVFIILKVKYSL